MDFRLSPAKSLGPPTVGAYACSVSSVTFPDSDRASLCLVPPAVELGLPAVTPGSTAASLRLALA